MKLCTFLLLSTYAECSFLASSGTRRLPTFLDLGFYLVSTQLRFLPKATENHRHGECLRLQALIFTSYSEGFVRFERLMAKG